MFPIRNAVLVALMQIAVIVIGVLATHVSQKIWSESIFRPFPTVFIGEFGVFCLGLPLVWIITALHIRQQEKFSDDLKGLVFYGGVLLLILLAAFFGYGVIKPWITVCFGNIGEG